jgi:two-component SAPR family response regulator
LTNLFSEALNSAGLNAVGFDDPLSALVYLREHHSDIALVVTDWKMPKMSGLELAKKIEEIDKEIRIVLISAYELEHDDLREIEKDEYMKKPLSLSTLIERVKKELAQTPVETSIQVD